MKFDFGAAYLNAGLSRWGTRMKRHVSHLLRFGILGLLLVNFADGNHGGGSSSSSTSGSSTTGGGSNNGGGNNGGNSGSITATTTLPPPVCPTCIGPLCEVTKELDVVVLVDRSPLDGDARLFYSGSADTSSAQATVDYKNFIKDVIGGLDVENDVRVAAFDMNQSPNLLWSFSDSRTDICTAVDDMILDGNGRHIDASISAAQQLFQNQGRSRSDALLSIVVISYGLSNNGLATEVAAETLHNINLPVTVVSIGPPDIAMEDEAAALVGFVNQVPFFSPSFSDLSSITDLARLVLAGMPTAGGRFGGGPNQTIAGGLFVTDLSGGTLNRRLNDGTFDVVLDTLSFPTGIDFDPLTGFIFWTTYFPEELWRAELDANGHEVPGSRRRLDVYANPLTSETVHIIRSTREIVVSIWTEGIYSYNFDGSHKRFIIKDDVLHCHGVLIDEEDNMIAFTDFFTEDLYIAPLDLRDQPLPSPKNRLIGKFPTGIIMEKVKDPFPSRAEECCKINPDLAVNIISLADFAGLRRFHLEGATSAQTLLSLPDEINFGFTGGVEFSEGKVLFTDNLSRGIYMFDPASSNQEFVLMPNTGGRFIWPYAIRDVPLSF